jgi:hypothetical protein
MYQGNAGILHLESERDSRRLCGRDTKLLTPTPSRFGRFGSFCYCARLYTPNGFLRILRSVTKRSKTRRRPRLDVFVIFIDIEVT